MMGKVDKRPSESDLSPSNCRRIRRSSSPRSSPPQNQPKFVSYIGAPNLPAKLQLLCHIIATTPSSSVEEVLNHTNVRISQYEVEEILKLSYSFPAPVVKFFRWSGLQLNNKHSPYAWNLVVDLLGKNSLFDPMWDAIKSMNREGHVSLATFASVFSSYVIAGQVREAIFTFDVLEQYGIPQNAVALNTLLSAICQEGATADAAEFLKSMKVKTKPDCDSYAILLEGWEKERNVAGAKETLAEMVAEMSWEPSNVLAYDSFLCTLIRGRSDYADIIKYLQIMGEKNCYPGVKFFTTAIDDCLKNSNVRGAASIWDAMVGKNRFRPDVYMYNSMIALYSESDNTDMGKRLLDEMVYNGVFPESETYNLLFQSFVKSRKARESSALFNEMVKNECFPSRTNCNAAIRIFLEKGDPYLAIKVWKFTVDYYKVDLEDTGNSLVVGLHYMHMIPEAVKYADDMIDRGIRLTSSTMSKLKQSLTKARKEFIYEGLSRKLQAC